MQASRRGPRSSSDSVSHTSDSRATMSIDNARAAGASSSTAFTSMASETGPGTRGVGLVPVISTLPVGSGAGFGVGPACAVDNIVVLDIPVPTSSSSAGSTKTKFVARLRSVASVRPGASSSFTSPTGEGEGESKLGIEGRSSFGAEPLPGGRAPRRSREGR